MVKMTFDEYDTLSERLNALPVPTYIPDEHDLKQLIINKKKHPEIKEIEFLLYLSECGRSNDKEEKKRVKKYIYENLEILDVSDT